MPEDFKPEFKNYYNDQLDGAAQSYESFETMTTDSECYRDWRHSIDFTNGILGLNNYNHHNSEIMAKAYEQLYEQQHSVTAKSLKDEAINLSPPIDDLYPISLVPYDLEPKSIHLYHAQVHDDYVNKLDDQELKDVKYKDVNEDYKIEFNASYSIPNNLNEQLNNEKDKVNKPSINDTINKLNTLVTIRHDGKVNQKLITNSDLNLDKNMNLLNQNS